MLTVTKTATVGGFEIYFKKDPKHDYGLDFNPTQLIFLSVLWSLKTAIFRHVKILSMEKDFFGFKAKAAAFLWGLVSTLRRVLGIVAFFIPCLGLMNLLWHWHGEQFPFSARKAQVMRLGVTPSPDEKIELYRMRKDFLWSDLDR